MRKFWDIFKTLAIFALLFAVISRMSGRLEEDYSGRVYVVDGDTVIIGSEKIRLEGIDAPEIAQLCSANAKEYFCGERAKAHLKKLVRTGEFHCKAWQRDKYERLLGQCFVAENDINARMVLDGWALSFGEYQALELEASRLKNGMWAGKFQRPVNWRREMRGSVIELPHKTRQNKWWQFW